MIREPLWNGFGIDVNTTNAEDAISQAKLDWNVELKPLIWNNEPTDKMVIQRADTKAFFGVCGKTYTPVQNKEAFSFVNSLEKNGLTFEKVGVSNDGKRIWMLAKMPDHVILDDLVSPYILLVNSHDATESLKVCITPVRVPCQNTINFAFKKAVRSWSTNHVRTIKERLDEARTTLIHVNRYMNVMTKEAERLVNIRIGLTEYSKLSEKLFPISKKDSKIKIENQIRRRDRLTYLFNYDDLGNFRGTAWGFLNAVSDYVMHSQINSRLSTGDIFEDSRAMLPQDLRRNTNRMINVAQSGDDILDLAYKIVSPLKN